MKDVQVFGKVKGANTDKWNRVAKLIHMYEDVIFKLDGIIERGSVQVTHNFRVALCTKLLMCTGIRVGNESSAEGYVTKPHPHSIKEPEFVQTYGLTTMLREHVTIKGGKVTFNFLGKKQVDNTFVITDKLLVSQIKIWFEADIPTDTFFDISVSDLTGFIKKSVGKQFTPKDFRTMRANVFAWEAFKKLPKKLPTTKTQFNAEVKAVCTAVSEKLNNTPGVCKKSYIDDMLFAYMLIDRFPPK